MSNYSSNPFENSYPQQQPSIDWDEEFLGENLELREEVQSLLTRNHLRAVREWEVTEGKLTHHWALAQWCGEAKEADLLSLWYWTRSKCHINYLPRFLSVKGGTYSDICQSMPAAIYAAWVCEEFTLIKTAVAAELRARLFLLPKWKQKLKLASWPIGLADEILFP